MLVYLQSVRPCHIIEFKTNDSEVYFSMTFRKISRFIRRDVLKTQKMVSTATTLTTTRDESGDSRCRNPGGNRRIPRKHRRPPPVDAVLRHCPTTRPLGGGCLPVSRPTHPSFPQVSPSPSSPTKPTAWGSKSPRRKPSNSATSTA